MSPYVTVQMNEQMNSVCQVSLSWDIDILKFKVTFYRGCHTLFFLAEKNNDQIITGKQLVFVKSAHPNTFQFLVLFFTKIKFLKYRNTIHWWREKNKKICKQRDQSTCGQSTDVRVHQLFIHVWLGLSLSHIG